MKEMCNIQGAWSDEANGWVSETIELTGDVWLEATLPQKGRLVIKKSEAPDGPWPKALITKRTGPHFRIRVFSAPHKRYIKIITTDPPNAIQYANI